MKYRRIYIGIGIIAGFLFLWFFSTDSKEKVEVYFSPGGNIQDLIICTIDEATRKIDVAMYAFTSKEISFALIRAHNRGLAVRVILDGGFIENEFSMDRFLYARGVDVKVHINPLRAVEKNYGKMHHKFAIIDDKIVITGSYNWTASAEERNEENLLVFPHSAQLAYLYAKEFNELWYHGVSYSEVKTPSRDFPLVSAQDLECLKKNARKVVKVYGEVLRVYYSERSNTHFLHFGHDRSSFSVVIFSTAGEKFLEQGLDPKYYAGKKVELFGRVVDHPKYGLEMIVEDPSQIKLIEKNG